MSDFAENENRPENADPCFIRCPSCGMQVDYPRTANNLGPGESMEIMCTNCMTRIRIS